MTVSHHDSEPLVSNSVFSIDYLNPGGISVKTREALTRAALQNPVLTEEQWSTYLHASRKETAFSGVAEWRAVRDTTDINASPEWIKWRKRAVGLQKIGIRNVEFDADTNTVHIDTLRVPYPAYQLFADRDASIELRDLSEATGLSLSLITSDNRLIVQHRVSASNAEGKPYNDLYGGTIGASAGGLLDNSPAPEDLSRAHVVSDDFLKDGVLKELSEEIGITPESLTEITLVGLGKDNIKPHHGFMFIARTNLSAAEVHNNEVAAHKNSPTYELDFDESFVDIPATPEAIRTLLCDSRMPPVIGDHVAMFIATGYIQMYQEHGEQAALKWLQETSRGAEENIAELNERVAMYYRNNPSVHEAVPERFMHRSIQPRPFAYSPDYTPEEQGLPDALTELHRLGLVS